MAPMKPLLHSTAMPAVLVYQGLPEVKPSVVDAEFEESDEAWVVEPTLPAAQMQAQAKRLTCDGK
jgi:hypothetical protein